MLRYIREYNTEFSDCRIAIPLSQNHEPWREYMKQKLGTCVDVTMLTPR
jgi:hypothetical protein